MQTTTETLKSGHKILAWRDTDRKDHYGEFISQALIEGHGWCNYYSCRSFIWIDGKAYTY